MLSFFTIAISLWASAHLYVGWRLIRPSRLGKRGKAFAWTAVLAFMLLVPAVFFLRRTPDKSGLLIALESLAHLNMGFFSILLPFLLLRDLGWLSGRTVDRIIALVHRLARKPDGMPRATPSLLPADPDRRRFFMQSLNVGVLGFSGGLTGFGYYEARRKPDIVRVSVPLPHLPRELEGFRIVQVSDTHVGGTIKRESMEMFVAEANALKPDLIAVTGDLVDGYVPEMRQHVEPIGDLRAPHGVYFITGNHEYYWDCFGWLAEVRRLGLTILLNEHRVIERGSSRILVAGATDYSAGRHLPEQESDPAKAQDGAPPCDVRLLLAHQPKSVYAAAEAGYDLQLSGHTHGGQFFPWNFAVRLLQPYVAGLHRHENLWIYVSRGTGYWGPPVRLAAPAEITLVTLTRTDGSA